MLRSLSNGKIDQLSIKFFHNILTTKTIELSYDITAFNKLAQKVDNLTLPKLLGGNLSLIQTSIGTNWQIKQNNDYCLLIEDVDEEAYSIDRMLNHLEDANIIKNCKAIFIGDVDVVDVNDKKDLNQVLKTFADNLHIPIFRINNIGHQKTNLGIPLGVNVAINA